jgi:ubiquinone/menaquinone biosynthesis C-methylase UbiE
MSSNDSILPYLHGFSPVEQSRLRGQAEFAESIVYRDVDFSECKRIVEIGSGVGAQTAILLRRFPRLSVTCVEASDAQIAAATEHLESLPYAKGRYEICKMDAQHLDFEGGGFDGAFLCWILEHVKDPARVLSETRRVLRPGAQIVVNEVMNSSFFLEPYSPAIWRYWMAFNNYQHDNAGDPFIGAKLGNLLLQQGYRNIDTRVKILHYDNRQPSRRREAIRYWKELLHSAKDQLLQAKSIEDDLVKRMDEEFRQVEAAPNAVFFYAFVQAAAQVG